MVLVPCDGFVHVEDGAGHGGHGGEIGGFQFGGDGRFADGR